MRIIYPTIENYDFNDRDDKTIYLGIETNIVCVDDRMQDFSNFYIQIYNGSIKDTSVTFYLGKIVFKKNKIGNLVPEYIPSNIDKSSLEGLNLFWLNERNPNPLKFTPKNKLDNPFYALSKSPIGIDVKKMAINI